jgi:hypothetical protein
MDTYIQEHIFKKYNIKDKDFWDEVNRVPEEYRKENIRVNKETYYLNHMINYVKQGIFKDLNNEMLFKLGAELEFCSGIEEFFIFI